MADIGAIDLSQVTHHQMVTTIHIQWQEDIASIVSTIVSTFPLAVDTIISLLSDITGMSRITVATGVREYETGEVDATRVRNIGGGRKRLTLQHPEIRQSIENIIESYSRGDPESSLRWTCKSVRNIDDFLADKGYDVSHRKVQSARRSISGH